MRKNITKICWFSLLLAAFGVSTDVRADAPVNPRSATAAVTAPGRSDAERVVRRSTVANVATQDSGRVSARNATGAVKRDGRVASRSTVVDQAGRAATSRAAVRSDAMGARSATGMARSATGARTSIKIAPKVGASRAASSRATAVFSDISKMGSGYTTCRDAYATCMDQFCANANDTYRRCYCSDRFTDFRDTEYALDEAKTLLQNFEDNYLNAVDKTAAEVEAMYSASVGEAAIKNDTSAAASVLAEIGDLLSGKKKAKDEGTSLSSLGVMELDFSTDMDDIWGGGSSLFDSGSKAVDMTELEGKELFNASEKQCLQLIAESCENDAVLNMSKSSYGIMITQDCNLYQKNIDAKREQVEATVRTAEKYLREARLEEYRAHNSQDVNECLDKVKTAITAETACGANYKRCLDPTGAYINQTTGEPIYTARLFQLANLINLDGSGADVLAQNKTFNNFLDDRRMFATQALDTCRDQAETVWNEFKRSALIEISQAQEEKLEEVRMSCVSTMKECYDTQSGALKDFDETTAQAAGALSAYAAKAMCQDKVVACAALYGSASENAQCQFDGSGRITNGQACGLGALLAFVNSVDDTRVAEGCEVAVENYLTELCTPAAGDKGYPWGCRSKAIGKLTEVKDIAINSNSTLSDIIAKYAYDNCKDPTTNEVLPTVTTKVSMLLEDVQEELGAQLIDTCESLTGTWVYSSQNMGANTQELPAFSTSVFGGKENPNAGTLGKCVESTVRVACLSFNADSENPVATYNENTDSCTFSASWYESQCKLIGGLWEDNVCYY